MWRRLLEEAFPIRQGEWRLTLLLFLHGFFAVGAFSTGRAVRDALFLSHGEASTLPWLIAAAALAVAGVGLAYTPLAARVRRDRMALGASLLFALLYALAFLLERRGEAWVYPALYVAVEVMGALALVQFWTLANELFHAREARRLYGFIGSGGTVANLVLGLATALLARALGAHALLLLCAALSLGTAGAALAAGRLGRQRLVARAASARGSPRREADGVRRVLSHPHLRAVAVLSALTFFTTTLVDYEFKVVARASLERDALAAFFGQLTALVGALALGLQLFGVNRLLRGAGVVGALAVLPLSLGVGNLALALAPALWAASLAKGADTLLRYSINDAASQLLYLPVATQERAASKAFVEGVVKPLAIGASGLALVAWQAWRGPHLQGLAWAGVALCAGWALWVAGLRSQYVRVLQDNLRRRVRGLGAGGALDVRDGATRRVLLQALSSTEPREVLGALELLHRLESPGLDAGELDTRVEALLEHPEPAVRVAALGYFAARRQLRFANALFRCFDDAVPEVRAAAIEAFCVLGRDKALRNVRAFLADPHPAVRSAAITGMIRYGGLDGVLLAAEALKGLVTHPEAPMRAHAAAVLGAIGVQNFYQQVLELMRDGDAQVRRRAVQAAGVLKSPELILPLLYRTASPETGTDAVEALAAHGPPVLPTLAKVLGNPLEEVAVRRAVARVLARIPTPESVALLVRHLDAPDEELRTRLYRSLARLVRTHRLGALERRPVEATVARELERAWATLATAEALGLAEGEALPSPTGERARAARALLACALREKVQRIEQRLFLLLGVLYPEAGLEHLFAGIRDASPTEATRRRANAVELLDNLLPHALKRRLLPLLEEAPRALKLRAVEAAAPQAAAACLRALCRDESAWVRACALFLLAEEADTQDGTVAGPEAGEEAVAACSDAHPVVREAALRAAVRLVPQRRQALLRAHLQDESPVVQAQARALLAVPERLSAAS